MKTLKCVRYVALLLCVIFVSNSINLSALAEGDGPGLCAHDYVAFVQEPGTAATCTEAGSHTLIAVCEECGGELGRQTVTDAALGHDYRETARTEPGFGVDGSVTYVCSRCGDSYVERLPGLAMPEEPEEEEIPEEIPEEPAQPEAPEEPEEPEAPEQPEAPVEEQPAEPDPAAADPQTADEPEAAEYTFTLSKSEIDPGSYSDIGSISVKVNLTEVGSVNYWLDDGDFTVSVPAGATVDVDCLPDRDKGVYIDSISYTDETGSNNHLYGEGDRIDDVGFIRFTMPECAANVHVTFDIHAHWVNLTQDTSRYTYVYSGNPFSDPIRTGAYVNIVLSPREGCSVAGVEYSYESGGETVTGRAWLKQVGGSSDFYQFIMPNADVTVTPLVGVPHTVTAAAAENGTVTVDAETAVEGQIVTVTVTPDPYCTLSGLTYTPDGGSPVDITADSDGAYTFEMPGADVTVAAAFERQNAWQAVQDQIDNAFDGDEITLQDDITAAAGDMELTFGMNRDVTLNLNGHTINRAMQSAASNGYAIRVMGGSVTITGGGTVTGGMGIYEGGGICVSGGSLTLSGGTDVTGNSAIMGGGIYVGNSAALIISGGSVTGNTATEGEGGGVYVRDGGSFTLSGGSISGNSAPSAGGGVYLGTGSVTITGGSITGNTTGALGGGIYLGTAASVSLGGGSAITVKNNLKNSTDDNLYMPEGGSFACTAVPAEGSEIHVYLQGSPTRQQPLVIATAPADCTACFVLDSQTAGTEVSWDADAGALVLRLTGAITSWADVQDALSAGGVQETADGDYIVRLGDDITAGSDDEALCFQYVGHPVILDLDGHTLNRNMSAAAMDGNVLTVQVGELVIRDSAGGGVITGGKNNGLGGGILVQEGYLTLAGGTVSGNTATNGGGVAVQNNTFTMTGGSITGNTAGTRGGGVYVDMGAFSITGGSITGNSASTGAGVYMGSGTSISIGNGSIIRIFANGDQNIYLQSGMSIAVDSLPAAGSQINVYLSDNATRQHPVTVATSSEMCDYLFTIDQQQSNTELDWDSLENTVILRLTNVVLDWAELQDALDDGGNWEMGEEPDYEWMYVIRLGTDITADSSDTRLLFDHHFDHPVILDLCGYTISRGLTSETDNGNVLTVTTGELILRDSVGGGSITGGYNVDQSGSGVIVDGGAFTMESGRIAGNTIKDTSGAGVCLRNGTFNMKGGSITGNTAIECNGAGVFVNGGTFNMTGGSITGNTADYGDGGGVYVAEGSFRVSGHPTVTGNTGFGKSSNVFLFSGCLISLDGALTSGASIGIGAFDNGCPITDDSYAEYHAEDSAFDFFTADKGFTLYISPDDGITPCVEYMHVWPEEPEWTWNEDCTEAETSMHCVNCGLEDGDWATLTTNISGPEINAESKEAAFTASTTVGGRTCTDTHSMPLTEVPDTAPYVGEDGRYVYGCYEHLELTRNGEKSCWSMDGELDEEGYLHEVSWFDFANGVIKYYTGPATEQVEIPATMPDGTAVTALGYGNLSILDYNEFTGPVEVIDHGSITAINAGAFADTANVTLKLSTADTITVGNGAFEGCTDATVYCNHAAGLTWGAHDDATGQYTVEYLDAHEYMAMGAQVEDDYSAATLTLGCINGIETGQDCAFEVVLDATVTVGEDQDHPGSYLATVTAVYESVEYTMTTDVEMVEVDLNIMIGTTAEQRHFKVPKAIRKDYAVFTISGLDEIEFDLPAGADFVGWTDANGNGYGPNDTITVRESSAVFSATWESTWAAVQEALLVDGAYVYLYNSIQAGPEDLPLTVPAGQEAILILRGCEVDRNLSAAADDGYAIRVDGTLYINENPNMQEHNTGGTVKGGKNTGSGGGIYVSGELHAREMTVSGNSAAGNGGGICILSGASATLTSVTVENNSAVNGGAVFVSRNGIMNTDGCSFYHNIVSKDGGGIYVADGGKIVLSGGSVTYCEARNGKGGGIYLGGDAEVLIDDNTQSSGGSGGPLRIVISSTIIGCVVAFCIAGVGGGIYFNKGTLNIGPGTEVINNTNTLDTFDNLDGNSANNPQFEIPELDPTMPIKIGIPAAAAGAAGGAAGGIAGWLQGLFAAGAAVLTGALIGGLIYYFSRAKESDDDRQDKPCTHDQGWENVGFSWEENEYSYVDEIIACKKHCGAWRYNRMTPTSSVNGNEQTVYTATSSDTDGTTDERIVEPFELLMVSNLFEEQMSEIRIRIPHGRGQGSTYSLPSVSPWSFSPTCIEFTGWELGDDSVSTVNFKDKEDDGRTKTVVASWKVTITYDSGVLIEDATLAGKAPQDPNPSTVPLGSPHTLLPCTWEQYVLVYDSDGEQVKALYTFDGWDISTGVRIIDGITPDYIFEAVTGMPGQMPGTEIPAVLVPIKIKAKWLSPWNVMTETLNKEGSYKLPQNTYALQLDTTATIKARQGGGETVLDLNGCDAHVYLASLTMNAFTVEGKFRVKDSVGGGCISDGKALSNGGGVNVKSGGVFTLEAGTIKDNVTLNPMITGDQSLIPFNGGGVYVGGTFIMKSGSIKDNDTSCSGGGVYIDSNATFRMTGGEITGNTARFIREHPSFLGGGVYVAGTFEVSGKITIQDNKLHDTTDEETTDVNNVYLPEGKTITVIGKLDAATRIGVTMQTPGVITSGLKGNAGNDAWGSAENFVSDNDAYMVVINADGEAVLVQKCTVTFEKGDENATDKDDEGNDLMPEQEVQIGSEYELPENNFGAPEGKQFKEWSVKIGEAEAVTKKAKDKITVTADTVVTAVWEDPPVLVNGVSGSFNEKIKLNFYFEIPDYALEDEGAYVTLTNDTTKQNEKLFIKDAELVSGKGYKFSISLAAKEAGDTIIAKVFDGEDKAITLRGASTGTDYTEEGLQHSLMKYFTWLETNGTTSEKKIGAAAKDYCSAARIYFDYNTEGATVSDAVDAVTEENLADYIADRDGTLPTGVSVAGITAMLEADNTLRLYLKFKKVDPGNLTFRIDNKSTELKQRSDGMYYLALDTGVWSNKLRVTHNYTVSDGENTFTITASVLTLARAFLVNDDDGDDNLGKAMYLYSEAARLAFGD